MFRARKLCGVAFGSGHAVTVVDQFADLLPILLYIQANADPTFMADVSRDEKAVRGRPDERLLRARRRFAGHLGPVFTEHYKELAANTEGGGGVTAEGLLYRLR